MMKKFPEGFIWGSATASYQVEGAVNEGGKGAASWDIYYHSNDKKLTCNGDIAADHYHKFREDVKLLKEIGQNGYRFSISWPRVFPEGHGIINKEGLEFYSNLIDELIKNDIEPNVTIYHWDMPQRLLENGGWLNRDNIEYFVQYAKCLFEHFGDRVSKWTTINEPASEVMGGYMFGAHPPQEKSMAKAFQVSHNMNIAHARVVKLFREMHMKGDIGIVLNPIPMYPNSELNEDKEAAHKAYNFFSRWYLDPIMKAQYPEDMFKYCKEKYKSPEIKPGDMELLKEYPVDFLGINYYMRRVAAANSDSAKKEINDEFKFIRVEDGEYTDWGWEIYPEGMYDLLLKIKKEYGDIPIYITENGMGAKDDLDNGEINDDYRINYLERHVNAMYDTISAGVDIRGYYVWSTLDLLSWTNGYDKRYGLIYVDFNTLERKLKKSAHWYKKVIANNGLDV